MSKVILNCLPPIEIIKPSISLEVIKSHLENKGVNNAEIIYWNIIIYDILIEAGMPSKEILINNNSLLHFIICWLENLMILILFLTY